MLPIISHLCHPRSENCPLVGNFESGLTTMHHKPYFDINLRDTQDHPDNSQNTPHFPSVLMMSTVQIAVCEFYPLLQQDVVRLYTHVLNLYGMIIWRKFRLRLFTGPMEVSISLGNICMCPCSWENPPSDRVHWKSQLWKALLLQAISHNLSPV